MKILLTGAAGYLGSQLCHYLLHKGHQVIAYDSMIYGGESLLSCVGDPNLNLVRGDIRDGDKLYPFLEEVDCLIHLAGIVGEPACNTNTEVSNSINLNAAIALVDAAKQRQVEKLIYVSTCSNYGVSEPNSLADESSTLKPLSDYARAKVAVEQHLMETRSEGITILRLGTLCGLSPRMRFDLLINEMARAMALEQEILIYAPQAWRPYLGMSDAVANISKVIESDWDHADSPVFNIVGDNLRKSDLVDMVLKHQPEMRIRYQNTAPDLRDYRVSAAKFSACFGKISNGKISDSDIGNSPVEADLLAVARAVRQQLFPDPMSPKYSAIPLKPLK